MSKLLQSLMVGAGLLAVESIAMADSVVPAAVTTKLSTDGVDTATAIGGAILTVAVVVVLFKWAKAGIFG